jgi:hypothetical protein
MKPFSALKPHTDDSQNFLHTGLWRQHEPVVCTVVCILQAELPEKDKGGDCGKEVRDKGIQEYTPSLWAQDTKMTNRMKDKWPSDQGNTRSCPGENLQRAQIPSSTSLEHVASSETPEIPSL